MCVRRDRDSVGVCVISAKHASTVRGAHIVLQGRRLRGRSNILLLNNASTTFEDCVFEGLFTPAFRSPSPPPAPSVGQSQLQQYFAY